MFWRADLFFGGERVAGGTEPRPEVRELRLVIRI